MKIIEKVIAGLFTKKVEVAKVDVELCQKLLKLDKDHDAMHAAMHDRIEAFVEQLNKEHKPVCNAIKQKTKDVWEQIYDAAGIVGEDREKPYSLNHKTGVLSLQELDPALKEDFEKFVKEQ